MAKRISFALLGVGLVLALVIPLFGVPMMVGGAIAFAVMLENKLGLVDHRE